MAEEKANPKPNGADRDDKGRFRPGNRASVGRGNPYAEKATEWRKALCGAVTTRDIRDVVLTLVAAAKKGRPWAVKELLDRCLGKAQIDLTSGGEAIRFEVAPALTDEERAVIREIGQK